MRDIIHTHAIVFDGTLSTPMMHTFADLLTKAIDATPHPYTRHSNDDPLETLFDEERQRFGAEWQVHGYGALGTPEVRSLITFSEQCGLSMAIMVGGKHDRIKAWHAGQRLRYSFFLHNGRVYLTPKQAQHPDAAAWAPIVKRTLMTGRVRIAKTGHEALGCVAQRRAAAPSTGFLRPMRTMRTTTA